ncbi:MAG: hypothetical protein A2516_10050 [Alphaproteobacteria bacterium RIFOXYD12_FULL_60_8]|nr:MAG: hypothetical protein A2516_10050 [Alphaproteobacteria bacterium RIFOXYD12_FULL_60_8]
MSSDYKARLDRIIAETSAQIERGAEERRKAVDIPAACPLAQKIYEANLPGNFSAGVKGGMQAFDYIFSPRCAKMKAAETIMHLRRNWRALRWVGRDHRQSSSRLLEKAASYRRQAAHLIKQESRNA